MAKKRFVLWHWVENNCGGSRWDSKLKQEAKFRHEPQREAV
jgi:hypothetical protein